MLRKLRQPPRKRTEMIFQQSSTGILQEPLHDRECLQLSRREPESWQLVRFIPCILSRVTITASVRIEDDRSVEIILERVDRAVKRRL